MYTPTTKISTILEAIQTLNLSTTENLILLFAEKNVPDIPTLIEALNDLDIAFCGGIFPSVIVGNEQQKEGVILKKMPAAAAPMLIKGLDSLDFSLPEFDNLPIFEEDIMMVVLLDGLTTNISPFLRELYNLLGNAVNYIGGGAGSLTLVQQPCVFNNQGLFQDAAILCPILSKSELGVRHGWEQIYGPLVANKTCGNVIQELNWKNAFETYKEIVEQETNQELTVDNFFDIAKGFPFGLNRDNNEKIVRDPIAVNEKGELICVGEVPENSVLDVLIGRKESLINAAGEAAKACVMEERSFDDSLVIDCISRVLFLENDFEKELEAIQKNIPNNKQLEGVLTLGEISSHGQGALEFFNKTIVVGLLYDG